MSISEYLDQIEKEQAEIRLNGGINRNYYIEQLLNLGFEPSEAMIGLYSTWYMGKHTSWWCKKSMRFTEFYDALQIILGMVNEVVVRRHELTGKGV